MGRRLTSALVLLCMVACNTSTSGTDREKAREEIHAQDRWHRQTMPRVPPTGAVGCDVCPYWCTVYDLSQPPASELVPRYRKAAIEHIRVERYGRAWERLEVMACMTKTRAETLRASWLQLVHDQDEAVRYCAAVHAIQHELAVDEGVAVLRHLVQDNAVLRTDARVQLLRWAGGLPVEL